LNPGKTKALKVGDEVKVPNVEPFEIGAVKDIKPGGDVKPQPVNDLEDAAEEKDKDKKGDKDKTAESKPAVSVKVDTKTNMLEVHEADKLIAAYPVTIGSAQTESPIGEWKVKGVARLPDFRYDEKLLKEGKRSDDSHLLHPGPNNPVGVIWIALNKKGNGLHGTNDPDAIGRSASHGCVRLANWDVARLAGKVKAGVTVSIH
jgi:lipoprotein-anchoring transpeptidase ErfK/SrfK